MKRKKWWALLVGPVVATCIAIPVAIAATSTSNSPKIYPYVAEQCRLSTPIDVGRWHYCPTDETALQQLADEGNQDAIDAIAQMEEGDDAGYKAFKLGNLDRFPAGTYTMTFRAYLVDKPDKRVERSQEIFTQQSWILDDTPGSDDPNEAVTTPPEHLYTAEYP